MAPHALFVGGTQFIGRRAVREFRDHGYEITLFTRGEHENPFADVDAYVSVSSGAVDGAEESPKREGETDLRP